MVKETVVEVEGLRKHYPPDVKAVDGVDFEIHAGEVFSLLGPNGAGKTTTVEILEGLRNPTAGQIRVLGAAVPKDYARIRKRVGVLPQNFDPFDRLKARETVAYWAGLFERSLRKKEVDALLRTVGLTARADALAMHLSGGEKRRLGIAMALVGEPELVFLDEPTTGLDPHGRRELWQVIRDLQHEPAIAGVRAGGQRGWQVQDAQPHAVADGERVKHLPATAGLCAAALADVPARGRRHDPVRRR